jgi:hypothetical protein
MSKIIDFKPRKPPMRSPQELPHYHSIVCELSELTPKDRLSVIAASCPDEDYSELLELAAYAVGPQAIEIVRKVLARAGDEPEPVA